jgi:phosphonoacetaldehyde hydrolase
MREETGIALVVFDWAGTVIDFGCRAPLEAFMELFARQGVPLSVEEAAAPMGRHKKDHLRALLDNPDIRERWRKQHGRVWNEADLEALYQELAPLQLAAIERYTNLTPDVHECVAELRRRGIRIAGTTGYFRAAAERCAAAAQFQGYTPDCNVCGDDVPAGRPAPWMIFRCMEALGIYPPAVVVKVGDTLVDIEEGRNAGAWSVGMIDSSSLMGCTREELAALPLSELLRRREEIRTQLLAAGAHAVIESLVQLPPVIDDLAARVARGERP